MPSLAELKLIAASIVFALYTYGVWSVHSWYDDHKEVKAVIAQEKKLADGQTKELQYQQKVRKIYVKVKDECINTTMPDDIKLLLSEPTAKLP